MRYEKGRKDASRRRIIDVAAEHFRRDGIAATGLTGIMSAAGLTNGAFYPHFQSKAELVCESMAGAMEAQSHQLRDVLATGGLDMAIGAYLSPEHRDNPGSGCASAALLPELARQPAETRRLYAERFQELINQLSAVLPSPGSDPEGVAVGIYATLIGTLQLARAMEGTPLSDRILAAGAAAARALAKPAEKS